MANLTALILLVAVAIPASAHTTTVTTKTVMEEGKARDPSCVAEMQQKMPLQMCTMWIKSKISRRNSPGPGEQYLEECCAELTKFSSRCRCDAVEAVATSVQYGPMEEMRRRACSLPGKCEGIGQCSCGGAIAFSG